MSAVQSVMGAQQSNMVQQIQMSVLKTAIDTEEQMADAMIGIIEEAGGVASAESPQQSAPTPSIPGSGEKVDTYA